MKKWLNAGFTALLVVFVVYQYGNLIYLNLRPADPILPGWEEYDAQRFAARNASGEPMLVEIYASWCPTCKAQHEAFEHLVETGQQPPIRAIRVDYDRDTAFREKLGINYTGALLIFENGREIARQGGITSPNALTRFLAVHGYAAATANDNN